MIIFITKIIDNFYNKWSIVLLIFIANDQYYSIFITNDQ